jgi:DNA-binding MarR family transcriptional regulator/catechol 2,3-dioxygenase-like lactoylglutathione lyase family enzyme
LVNLLDQLRDPSYSRLVTDGNAEAEGTAHGEGPNDDTPTPTLMRGARGAYAHAIRAELESIGIDDLPRNGAFVLFRTLAADGAPGGRGPSLSAQLGISKQAVSQLIETLVRRGYLLRGDNPEDGRRVDLDVTERGREVLDAVARAVDSVDEELAAAISTAELRAFRKALTALADIKTDRILRGVSKRRPRRERAGLEPILAVRDLAVAMAHYESLGFKTHSFDEGYGFANWRGFSIHLAVQPGHDAEANRTAVYLQTLDADAVQAAWSKPGLGGVTSPVEDTSWGMREGSHTDPDGNVIRFGSALR